MTLADDLGTIRKAADYSITPAAGVPSTFHFRHQSDLFRSIFRRLVRRVLLSGGYARREYRETAAWAGFVGAFLWPLYGLFCHGVLGLPERMTPRILLGIAYFSLAVLARTNHFGAKARWLWVASASVGMVWLPWMLYLDSEHASYWVASMSFFGTLFGFALRPWDMIPAIAIACALILSTGACPNSSLDIGIVAVLAISMWIGSRMVSMLLQARRRIEFQNRRIRHQNLRLMELDRAKNEFTAGIAHDLRTPLTVAVSLADDLSSENLSPIARTRLDSLVMALDQMRRQSEDLLDLERFQLGVAKLDPADIDVLAWVGRFEEGLTSLARARGITFQVVHHAHALHARFDPVRMQAVLHNLVANAFKFTPDGGHVEVHLAHKEGRTLVLSVIDDGEGIPSAALPRIFDRFQQVDRGPGTYTVGAGIGLALVREIVEAHHGSVHVESTPTLGSLFEVNLPGCILDDAPIETCSVLTKEAILPSSAPTVPPARGQLLALVVEDDTLLRHVLRDLLDGTVRAATARDGREGLRLAHELRPDIVISDVSMPLMDGVELLANLRADPILAKTPVILLSGDPLAVSSRLTPDEKLSIQAKPFDRVALIQAIRDLTN